MSREEQRDRRLAALGRWARQHTRSGARGRGARAASAGTAAAARRRDPLRTTTPRHHSLHPAMSAPAQRSPSRLAADAGVLPSISPQRGVHTAQLPGRADAASRPSTNKFWGLPDENDINACAYRVATPLQLSYAAPLSYDSDVAKAALLNRQRRATVRRMVLEREMDLLADAVAEWHSVTRQRKLEGERFARVSQILGAALGHPLSDAFLEWMDLVAHLKHMREKLTRFAQWLLMRDTALCFCRWQVLWAGCTDTRPVRVHGLRSVDYRRERTSRMQMDMFLRSDRGRNYLIALSNADGDLFYETCRQQALDLETLGEYTPEELADEHGPKMPFHKASGLYNRVKAMLHPTYFRIDTVLEYNPMTRMFLAQMEPLIEEFREMRRNGEHPLGKTAAELRVEAQLKKAQDDVDAQERMKRMALEGVGFNQMRVDARIKPHPSSQEALKTHQVPGTDMPEDAGWARGYVFEFPDRLVGDLDLQEVWVDLVLPEDSSAFVFICNADKVTGKPLHRSNVLKGRGMDEQQYRFQMSENNTCMVSNHHAVMVHITARHVPSRFLFWKEFRRVRKMNNILTIMPVECPKTLATKDSDKQLSMQFVFGKHAGQEELEPDPAKRMAAAAATPATTETPLTPQSRPETGRPETGGPAASAEATAEDDPNYHEKRKALQSSKSVRFYNEGEEGQEGDRSQKQAKDRQLSKLRRHHKFRYSKSKLARSSYFQGSRNMAKDMTTQRHANYGIAFNPRHNEFWLMEDFPSPWIICMDFMGRVLRKIKNFNDISPNCMTMDSQGNLYTSDCQYTFHKFRHERFWDPAYRLEADRMVRMWELRDISVCTPILAKNSRACGVAIDSKNEDILYAAFTKGPILLVHTTKAEVIGRIDPDPPFKCVTSICCCSDALVVGDSHQIKVFDLHGEQVSVLGQLYNDPCLLWTGLELYVGERRSTVWHCYQPKVAKGIELSRQHEKCIRWVYPLCPLFCIACCANFSRRSKKTSK